MCEHLFGFRFNWNLSKKQCKVPSIPLHLNAILHLRNFRINILFICRLEFRSSHSLQSSVVHDTIYGSFGVHCTLTDWTCAKLSRPAAFANDEMAMFLSSFPCICKKRVHLKLWHSKKREMSTNEVFISIRRWRNFYKFFFHHHQWWFIIIAAETEITE